MAGSQGQPPPCDEDGLVLIDNYAFDANPAGNGMAADLHAARLRLDATEADRAALESELASVQGRLHDALEVLEGALGERSALMRHNRDLQAQLGAALQRSPALGARADGADASAAVPPTPERRLRQELALAQAQLRELRAAKQAWEAERAALLLEVEDERQRLQQGLAEALTQASCAQRDADTAAERASHWCSLAEVLQRSALLPDAPASPASLGSPFGSTPGSSESSSLSTLRHSASRNRVGTAAGPSPAQRLLAEWRSPASLQQQASTADRYAAVSGSLSSSEEGPGLIAAFQAVAKHAPAEADAESAEDVGSSPLRPCASPPAPAPARPSAVAKSAGSGSLLAASSDLAPGSQLQLFTRLAAPGLSYGTQSPLTPVLGDVLPSKGPATPSTASVETQSASMTAGDSACASVRAASRTGATSRAPAPSSSSRRSFLSRLLCASTLPR